MSHTHISILPYMDDTLHKHSTAAAWNFFQFLYNIRLYGIKQGSLVHFLTPLD